MGNPGCEKEHGCWKACRQFEQWERKPRLVHEYEEGWKRSMIDRVEGATLATYCFVIYNVALA